jgi:hypothetical protein
MPFTIDSTRFAASGVSTIRTEEATVWMRGAWYPKHCAA